MNNLFELVKFIILLYTLISHGLLIAPSTPEQLIVERKGVTETEVTLSWKEPKPLDSSIVEYEIQYRKSGKDLFMKKENISNCQCEVTGLTAYTKYEFKVAAINSAGCGPFTDPVFQFTSKFSIQNV